ncbi:hypothetical protein ACHAXT_004329 [Thalassiosira profunda]
MRSQQHGKQRDRVASYAGGVGGMLPRINSSGGGEGDGLQPPTQKRKPYRARGCRGGASRKSRKHRPQSAAAGGPRDEENDPSRLNTNEDNDAVDASDKADAAKPNSAKPSRQANAMRQMAILPSGSGLNVHQTGGEPNAAIEVVALGASAAGGQPILPGALQNNNIAPSANCALSAIARPAPPSSARGAPSPGGSGFSFFCISPRSFLSGQRKAAKAPRMH